MARTVNPIKKQGVKRAILAGKSYKRAMMDNGYTERTANNGQDASVMRDVMCEIRRELKKTEVTIQSVLDEIVLGMSMAQAKGDLATYMRGAELKGKYLAMFTDKVQADITSKTLTPEELNIKLNRIKAYDILTNRPAEVI